MIPVKVEGVRRNFTIDSPLLYSVSLTDEPDQCLLVFGIERHEALPIVAALNHLTVPRPLSIHLMAETLTLLNYKLEEARIESYSMIPPLYHLCQCQLSWRFNETAQEQAKQMRVGDAIGLALLLEVPILVSDELFKQMGVLLADGQTPELAFARYLLKREGITVPEDKKLRLGHKQDTTARCPRQRVQGCPVRKSAGLSRGGRDNLSPGSKPLTKRISFTETANVDQAIASIDDRDVC
jgi:bifunctional DNase/RNase